MCPGSSSHLHDKPDLRPMQPLPYADAIITQKTFKSRGGVYHVVRPQARAAGLLGSCEPASDSGYVGLNLAKGRLLRIAHLRTPADLHAITPAGAPLRAETMALKSFREENSHCRWACVQSRMDRQSGSDETSQAARRGTRHSTPVPHSTALACNV